MRGVKPALLTLLSLVLSILGAAYFLRRDHSIDWQEFDPKFMPAVKRAGFHATELSNRSGNAVPVPWDIKRPLHLPSSNDPKIDIRFGFPNCAYYYKLASDNLPTIDCYVRFLEGRAAFILIRAPSSEMASARHLQAELQMEYPGFPVIIERATPTPSPAPPRDHS
jgi:hypothetical protein